MESCWNYTIRKCSALSPSKARKKAREVIGGVDASGANPAVEKRQQREALQTRNPTLSDLFDIFAGSYANSANLSERYLAESRRHFSAIGPVLGDVEAAKLSTAEIVDTLSQWAHSAHNYNRARALISKLMSIAVERDIRPDNPCRKIKQMRENRRERFLSDDEWTRLDRALTTRSEAAASWAKNKRTSRTNPRDQTSDVIRLLMLTGARSGETFKATWPEFDLDRGTWSKPSHHTKTKKSHVVRLSSEAIRLLKDIRCAQGNSCLHVFPNDHAALDALSGVNLDEAEVISTMGMLIAVHGIEVHKCPHEMDIPKGATMTSLPALWRRNRSGGRLHKGGG